MEITLNTNKWIRLTHRWLSTVFTVAVIINGIAVANGKYSSKLGLMAVFPLGLLFLTGMYLFFLPYAVKWSSRGRTG